jgi:outer membrane receptor protein involved in Fe transport
VNGSSLPNTGIGTGSAIRIITVNLLERRLYDLYVANPTWFRFRDAESHRFSVTEPYELNEKIYGAYVEFTGGFFRNKLTYVGGIRYEKVEVWGRAVLDRGTCVVVGIPDPIQQSIQRYVRKGARGEGENDGYFPSLQLNYHFTDSLILRAGYAKAGASRFVRSVIRVPPSI